jgi:hypothetical protein
MKPSTGPASDAHPDLTTESEAAAYAREQGGVLSIPTRPQHGCCGGRVDRATVSTAPPDDSDAFVHMEREGVAVYVHRSFVSFGREPIHVGLDALWVWKPLYVEAASRM